jgi:hypothetical protein
VTTGLCSVTTTSTISATTMRTVFDASVTAAASRDLDIGLDSSDGSTRT